MMYTGLAKPAMEGALEMSQMSSPTATPRRDSDFHSMTNFSLSPPDVCACVCMCQCGCVHVCAHALYVCIYTVNMCVCVYNIIMYVCIVSTFVYSYVYACVYVLFLILHVIILDMYDHSTVAC